MDKTIILVTGPIGVGKSTFVEKVLDNFPFPQLEYISSDLYYGIYFQKTGHSNAKRYANAKEYCWYKLKKAINAGESFIWETVVAKQDKIDFLRISRNYGYRIISLFITVDNCGLVRERVTKRYLEGWYDIPQNKLESRFSMVMENVQELIHLSDEFVEIDASDGFKPICSILNGITTFYGELR